VECVLVASKRGVVAASLVNGLLVVTMRKESLYGLSVVPFTS